MTNIKHKYDVSGAADIFELISIIYYIVFLEIKKENFHE